MANYSFLEINLDETHIRGIPLDISKDQETKKNLLSMEIEVEDFDDEYISHEPQKENILWDKLTFSFNEDSSQMIFGGKVKIKIPEEANFEDEESFFFFLAENGSGQVNVGLFYENNGDYISRDKYTLNFDLS